MSNDNPSHGERVARLEEHKEHTDKQIAIMVSALTNIEDSVEEIRLSMARSKGFIAGISFAFAAVGSLCMLVLQAAAKKMGWL
jgi:hypothetical protein